MVRDQHPRGKLQRRRSWKETLRAFTSSTETEGSDMKVPKLPYRRSTGLLKTAFFDAQVPRNASDEEDFRQWKEEDRPIRARVLYSYSSLTPSARNSKADQVGDTVKTSRGFGAAQISSKTAHKREAGRMNGTIGTRLTMTSRTGYFQDRIISPSMVRIMVLSGAFIIHVYRCAQWQSCTLGLIGILTSKLIIEYLQSSRHLTSLLNIHRC